MNNILKTEFDINGDIKDKELYEKFNNLIASCYVFGERELEICDLGLVKRAEYEEGFWAGNPDDISPSYISRTETEHMEYYVGRREPTQEDICLYFKKEPYEITEEDCENIDEVDFVYYLEEIYQDDLYQEAVDEFYKED